MVRNEAVAGSRGLAAYGAALTASSELEASALAVALLGAMGSARCLPDGGAYAAALGACSGKGNTENARTVRPWYARRSHAAPPAAAPAAGASRRRTAAAQVSSRPPGE
eukprot:TRINITY_DN15447_c0_g1_i3.p3 TRINITY_DN15447_c0_g1~~TRINITY_DN15447_c0_g1_i3.p3  ORF type:complete len:109 (+),score=8.77 TRINITY_DN15447_c0_g1_i3:104-430(+)